MKAAVRSPAAGDSAPARRASGITTQAITEFVLDPDGNNIEAVYHGEAKRSAASVTITS